MRSGLASRSGSTGAPGQGFFDGFGVACGLPEALGPGLPDGVAPSSLTATRAAWLMLSCEAQTRMAGVSSVPAMTYIARTSDQSFGVSASRYWARKWPFDLSS